MQSSGGCRLKPPPAYPRIEEHFRFEALSPQARLEAIRKMIEMFDLSERRACRFVGLSRDRYQHEPQVSAQTQAQCRRIIEIAHHSRRFDYRRVHDLLGVNHKREFRFYRTSI
jgi:hypothetical protein